MLTSMAQMRFCIFSLFDCSIQIHFLELICLFSDFSFACFAYVSSSTWLWLHFCIILLDFYLLDMSLARDWDLIYGSGFLSTVFWISIFAQSRSIFGSLCKHHFLNHGFDNIGKSFVIINTLHLTESFNHEAGFLLHNLSN